MLKIEATDQICALIQFSAAAMWPLTVQYVFLDERVLSMRHILKGAFADVA